MLVTFKGYNSPIKTMWKRGELPNVTRGLYGDILTLRNLSIEHLKPVSQGGRSVLGNEALASAYMNNLRGVRPLKEFVTKKMAWDYIGEFINDKRGLIQYYVGELYETFRKLGVL